MLSRLIPVLVATISSSNSYAGLNPTGSFDVVVRLAGASAVDNLLFNTLLKDICSRDISVLNKPATNELPHFLSMYWGVACRARTTADDANIDTTISGLNILFLKRSAGGSAFGVNTLLENPPRPITQIDPSTCIADGTYTSSITEVGTVDAWKCNNTTGISPSQHVAQDFGVSDVNPEMFRGGANTPLGFSAVTPQAVASKFGSVKGVVGAVFGIAVSKNLRDALQIAQFGALSPCVRSESEDCMPSLPKQLIQSIFTARINNWSQVNVNGVPLPEVPGVTAPTTTSIKICRRIPGSGTQATVNNVIMGAPCNSGGNAPALGNTPNIAQGLASPDMDRCLSAWNTGVATSIATDVGTGNFTVNSGNVTAWAIGMMGMEKAGANFRYVKLDGIAPTAKNVHAGLYPLWSEVTIQYRIDPPYGLSGAKLGLVNTLKNMVSRATNLKDLNAELPLPAYLALSTSAGQTPDAAWDPSNPVVAYTHGTSNTDNCRIPAINPTYSAKTPLGF